MRKLYLINNKNILNLTRQKKSVYYCNLVINIY